MKLLNGLLVVEVGQTLKAGYCGKLFVDAGAEVVKLQGPKPAQRVPSTAWLDRGKSSVILEWQVAEGRSLMHRLLGKADVLVSDLEAGSGLEELERVSTGHDRLVSVHLSDLGREGPFATRPSSDLVVSALSGMCYINGEAGRVPLREPGNQTAIVAALAGYLGVMAAIATRHQTGRGQAVQVSALEAMVNVLSPSVLQCSYQEGEPHRRAFASGYLVDCADGQVSIVTSSEHSWQTILDLWGLSVDRGDTRLATAGSRSENMQAVRDLFAPVLASRTRREVFEELCMVRVPCGMLLKPSELPADAHLVERESFQAALDGCGTFPGPSFRLAHEVPSSGPILHRLGEDTARVLAPLARNDEVRA